MRVVKTKQKAAINVVGCPLLPPPCAIHQNETLVDFLVTAEGGNAVNTPVAMCTVGHGDVFI